MIEKLSANEAQEKTLHAMINELFSQNRYLYEEMFRLDSIANRIDSGNYPKNFIKEGSGNDGPSLEPDGSYLPQLNKAIIDRRDIIESIKIAINFIEQAI